ncbi:DUF1127 domain-containing protein [Aureimonas sp. SK2]|uniref:DUF1127 domain-containing protein n=1 Tax=Aureimonas sp. SK2 TaxID=3015992 RepID=UPI002444B757|nr:DUF1127 domain-containing protein [Aureimonas sp. SK2]
MLARLTRVLDARRRRRAARFDLAHLDARLLADIGLRRAGDGEGIERLKVD